MHNVSSKSCEMIERFNRAVMSAFHFIPPHMLSSLGTVSSQSLHQRQTSGPFITCGGLSSYCSQYNSINRSMQILLL